MAPVLKESAQASYVDSSEQQLHFRLNIRSPITSPTIISVRPHYSYEIAGHAIGQGVDASGHEIRKRSPLVVPEDPFLVGGFLKKLSLPKAAKVAPIALPKKPYKIYKALTGPLLYGACAVGSIQGGIASVVSPLTLVIAPKVVKKFLVKVCPKLIPFG